MANVTVHQLSSMAWPKSIAFLNVIEAEGSVAVWGNTWQQPTFLLFSRRSGKDTFKLICFDSEGYALDWMKDNQEEWKLFMRLDKVADDLK